MSAGPPDDGSWDTPGTQNIEWYQTNFEADQLRPDFATVITEFIQAGPGGATVSHSEGTTVTWQINFSLQLNIPVDDAFFDKLNSTLGGQYSKAFTETNAYQETIPPNQTARIIYVPMYHHKIGTGKITIGYAPQFEGVTAMGTRVVGGDPNTIDVAFPIAGGQYQLQFR